MWTGSDALMSRRPLAARALCQLIPSQPDRSIGAHGAPTAPMEEVERVTNVVLAIHHHTPRVTQD